MNKYKRRSITALVIIIFIIMIFINFSMAKTDEKDTQVTYENYVISKGETLWSIAEEYKQEGQDTRDYIYQIKKLNSIGSTVYENQTIKIIVWEEEN